WDANLAHRDIKPANLLVREAKLYLIDVFFAEIHPSPWRQAVDLANMMLCLGLRSSPEQVYERALQQFTVGEITEAFAAARGLALPSQLRKLMRAQGRDLAAEFVRLLPTPPPRLRAPHPPPQADARPGPRPGRRVRAPAAHPAPPDRHPALEHPSRRAAAAGPAGPAPRRRPAGLGVRPLQRQSGRRGDRHRRERVLHPAGATVAPGASSPL